MSDRFDDIAGPRLAFAADHRRALVDATQRLAEVARAADEGDLERVLLDVVFEIRRRQNFALIDVVNADGLEDLRLDEVTDAALGHHRDRDRLHDAMDDIRIAHPRDAPRGANVSGYTLERHDRHGTGFLSDLRVLGGDDVHDHPAFEHLSQAGLQGPSALGAWARADVVTVLLHHLRTSIVPRRP